MGSTFELKLVIEKKSQKVFFAEVGQDVVNFLFSLLRLPIGSVAELLKEESTYGPLRNTYHSWQQLDHSFLSSTRMAADCFIPVIYTESSLKFAYLLSSRSPATIKEKVYVCNCNMYSDETHINCNNYCRFSTYREVSYGGSGITNEAVIRDGYVKGGFTYAVMDDLSIVPMTPVGSIAFFNKIGCTDLSLLEEKTVSLDVRQGLELLKTSFRSKNVLTDMFMKKEKDGPAQGKEAKKEEEEEDEEDGHAFPISF